MERPAPVFGLLDSLQISFADELLEYPAAPGRRKIYPFGGLITADSFSRLKSEETGDLFRAETGAPADFLLDPALPFRSSPFLIFLRKLTAAASYLLTCVLCMLWEPCRHRPERRLKELQKIRDKRCTNCKFCTSVMLKISGLEAMQTIPGRVDSSRIRVYCVKPLWEPEKRNSIFYSS